MALTVALEAKKEETRRMEASLRADFVAFVDKVKNRSMLLTMKQDLIAKEAPKAKFAEDFMVFIEAIENGDLQILKNFDEKSMINTVSTMMNSDAGNIGGLVGEYGNNFAYMVLWFFVQSSVALWLMLLREQTVLAMDPDSPVDVVAAAMETTAGGG
ncbi:hypothetical protein V6N12_016066 [Hibiscus sabdariffa]|uniref:Uncharacterized protein n=1 Tax=Hibiscus sabdariffa TaxID=183260 RepID=A0ABR2ALX7_9ROSI